MKITRIPPFLFVVFLWIQNGLCQDKYTDETRPYKFGFNIQGYQHRQEEKDERGLIKGEYGFITADGYYRVTVYATDENGDFRIISMKNYYVGFPPEDPQTTPQPQSARGQAKKTEPLPDVLTYKPEGQRERGGGRKKEPVKPIGQTGCSDCVIPTTKKPGQELPRLNPVDEFSPPIDIRTGGLRGNSRGGGSGFQDGGRRDPSSVSQTPGRGRGSTRTPGSDRGNVNGVNNFRGENVQNERTSQQSSRGRGNGSGGQTNNLVFPNGGGGGERTGPQIPNSGRGGERIGPQFPGGGRGGTTGAGRGKVTDSAGFGEPRPNIGSVRDGLPKGVTVDDIKALLYRFNYTVGFHGHHEDGYRNGDKEGDYFFDGRDGVERRVEYIANEFGYQPNITFIDLPENDERRPNELTEKEYGLKGYEFKWFYRK